MQLFLAPLRDNSVRWPRPDSIAQAEASSVPALAHVLHPPLPAFFPSPAVINSAGSAPGWWLFLQIGPTVINSGTARLLRQKAAPALTALFGGEGEEPPLT